MPLRMRRVSPLVLASLLLAGGASAQESRDPNPAEKKVLARYDGVMSRILDAFESPDWAEDSGQRYTLDDVAVHPGSDRPLDVTAFLGRSYDVRSGSARYARLLPLLQTLQAEPDPASKAKIGRQIQDLFHLAVEVRFNWTNVSMEPPPSQNQDLKVPGAALAYKVHDDSHAHGTAYVLLFGDWKKAKWDGDNNWLHYSFAHPVDTPYIENIVVQLWGADDRIQDLVKSIRWSEVNTALAL